MKFKDCLWCGNPFGQGYRGAKWWKQARFCSHKCWGFWRTEQTWQAVHRVENPDACWIWPHARLGTGYGAVKHEKRQTHAHRAAWIRENGPIPDGLFVLHRCDNKPCVRPSHLFLGTQLDNVRDMATKGRRRGGPNSPGRLAQMQAGAP